MPTNVPFDEFYRAVNGYDPLPWQRRLAAQVLAKGWPSQVGVPTGLGKTSCIDIAVWAMAALADRPDRMPTRVWYVVNRRLLVDAAWRKALRLQELLAEAYASKSDDAVGSVAASLSGLAVLPSTDGSGREGRQQPFYVCRLRGGAELGARPPDPAQPSLVLATVPMFASRWLFRGYASSLRTRSVDAAHAGIDTLVLLDEAHLARPLAQLNDNVALCDIGEPANVLPGARSRPRFVAMTATGETAPDRFDLDEEDLACDVVAKRLHATKAASLVETTKSKLAPTMADRALELVRGTRRSCVVFTNTPATARAVKAQLKEGEDLEVLLATGRMREREADVVRRRLEQVLASGTTTELERPLIVVATQTLEVGADLDFDHLVTETPGLRSLVQRLGRLNRLGDKPWATCVVCHPADQAPSWPVYADEPATVWDRLRTAMADAPGGLDLSPGNLVSVLGEPDDDSRQARVAELLPAHLWEWAKTSAPPPGEAPVEAFFEGLEADGDISVVWRADRPGPGVRLVPTVSESEAVSVPVGEAKQAFAALGTALQAQGPAQRLDLRRLVDGATLEPVEPSELRPGDIVVLGPETGLYDRFGWDPRSREVVLDVSPLLSGELLLASRSADGSPVRSAVLDNLAPGWRRHGRAVLEALCSDDREDRGDDQELVAELKRLLVPGAEEAAGFLHDWLGEQEWADLVGALGRSARWRVLGDGQGDQLWATPDQTRSRWRSVAVRTEVFDELSFSASSHELSEHLGAVGEMAARLGAGLGLELPLVNALKMAGNWHDAGKADRRFQRQLDPSGDQGALLAKSGLPSEEWERARAASGWPKGGRHELLSARLLAAWLAHNDAGPVDVELVLHLVSSHHGWGRPLPSTVDDQRATRVTFSSEDGEVSVSSDLGLQDWEQPGRFRRLCAHYGYWGLALMEAVLRQADMAVSNFANVEGVA